MYIIIFRGNATEIRAIGDHLLYDSGKATINDVPLAGALRIEVKGDNGGLLYVIDVPKPDFPYGQEIDFGLLKQPGVNCGGGYGG